MTKFIRHILIDKIGMGLSLICAIHCFSLPLILSAGSVVAGASSIFTLNETYEKLMWISSFSLAFISFKSSAFKYRYYLPVMIFACSAGLFAIHKIYLPDYHQIIMPFVGLLLVLAHWLNFRFIQKNSSCKISSVN